ncbi:MAG: isopenicillin N synthase family dioxygenase, partial [Hyphomicrobiales bacterium]
LPKEIAIDQRRRAELLRIFSLPKPEIAKLLRQKFAPGRPNVYRGWFPAQDGAASYKEGIDMGPDLAYGSSVLVQGDPLLEATPLPDEQVLPGWRAAAGDYYRGMERTARAVMGSIARGLGLKEDVFDAAFKGGISTLRLLHYPVRTPQSLAGIPDEELWVTHKGERFHVVGRAHVDSGFVTLLAQDGVDGLQAQRLGGAWVDVPPTEGSLAVNFGKLLERWTGGRVKATEHRVIGSGRERYSIPFFYEARVDAEIAPLPEFGGAGFMPFLYGDYVWASTTKFVEFHGMESMRKPRGAYQELA